MAEQQVGLELFKVAEQRAAAGDLAVAARFAQRAREIFEQTEEHDASCAAGSLEGRIRLQSGDLNTAHECFTWVRETAEEHGLAERELGALTELGTLLELTGDLNEAMRLHSVVLERMQAANNPIGTANALGNVGRLLTRVGNTDQAIVHLEGALGLFKKAGDAPGTVNALICLGDLARSKGQLAKAKAHFEGAAQRCDDPRAQLLQAVALLNLGHTMRDLGDRGEALALFGKSRDAAQALGDVQGVARARLGEAMALADSSDPGASITAFEEAEAAFLQIGQPPNALAATVNRAAVLCRVGRLLEGRDALVHARELLRRMGDVRGAAEVGLALCEVHTALGSIGEVDALLSEIDAAQHGPRIALRMRMVQARLAIRAGDLGRALQHLLIREEIELAVAESFALRLMLAEVRVLSGQFEDADALFAQLLGEIDRQSSPREHAAALMGRGLLALWSGDLDAAQRRYDSALDAWVEIGEPMPEIQCRVALMRVAALMGAGEMAAVQVLAGRMRDIGAHEAFLAVTAFCRALALRDRLLEPGNDDRDPDEVMTALAQLLERGNRAAAFAELAFAAALTKHESLQEALASAVQQSQFAAPQLPSRS